MKELQSVFHITSSSSFSGAEKIAIEIIQETQSEVASCYICKPGSIEKVLKERGIDYITYTNKRELLKIIKDHKPGILHCHDYTASIIGALSSGKIILSHIHNNTPFAKKLNLKSLLYFISSCRYKKIICVSEAIGYQMFFYNQIKNKIMTIHNWVNLEERKWGNIEKRDIDLLFVGRMTEQKNPFLFVDIVDKMKDFHPEINAVMIGDGELKERVENYIVEKGGSKNIIIKNFTTTPHKYMRSSKMFILTSTWEGFGLVVLEAMLNECIVISNPVGGVPEIIKDGESGFLCEELDDFVNKTSSVLKNIISCDDIIAEALQTLNDFNMETQIKIIYDLYVSLR